jgi:3-hydroxybutyryl-CoA dehydratase
MNEYQWADLRVGLRQEFDVELTPGMMEAFATLSGDVNPLHTDPAYARSHGFRDKVAFGLLTSSFYSRLVGVYLPGKLALLHGIDVQLVGPAYPGDVLHVSGEITYLTEAFRRLELKAVIENRLSGIVSKAKIRVGLLGT